MGETPRQQKAGKTHLQTFGRTLRLLKPGRSFM
ncbi:hypothetical protein C8J44_2349 [Sphingomonas sp. PP-CE-3A-406]|nr:hypothetical protein C8J44_2349 [Sphingomonas sp. PP-CE-3A-406]